jgi:hypothetical protein
MRRAAQCERDAVRRVRREAQSSRTTDLIAAESIAERDAEGSA